jgi:hypothetical protein
MSDHTPDWAEPARQALTKTVGELVATGNLSPTGHVGMLTAGTLVVEFIGDDGEPWHTIIGFPTESWRDSVVHCEQLRRNLNDAQWRAADD